MGQIMLPHPFRNTRTSRPTTNTVLQLGKTWSRRLLGTWRAGAADSIFLIRAAKLGHLKNQSSLWQKSAKLSETRESGIYFFRCNFCNQGPHTAIFSVRFFSVQFSCAVFLCMSDSKLCKLDFSVCVNYVSKELRREGGGSGKFCIKMR